MTEMANKVWCNIRSFFSQEEEAVKNIFKDDSENDTEDLVNDIFQLLDLIRQGEPTTSYECRWPARLSPLLDFLLSGRKEMKDFNDAMSEVGSLLEKIGSASFVTAGFSVVAYGLKRIQDVSNNKEECLSVLEEMNTLNKLVQQLAERDKLKEGMQQQIKSATTLIIKGSIKCLHQISSSPFSKLSRTVRNNDELNQIRVELDKEYRQINTQVGICILDVTQCKGKTLLSRAYPAYAVGIEKPLKEVTDLLEWGSAKNAVAVILYGFGGMGKTTLADAVFNRVKFMEDGKDCKYSHVELFKSTESSPNIIKLQQKILEDLMGNKNIPQIRKYQDGQKEISNMLEKVAAFIYIDNVLEKDELRQLLPLNFDNAKKVRLLITARDINVRKACRMTTPPREYLMRGISSAYSKRLLENQFPAKNVLAKEMPGNKEGILINSNQINRIVDKCGGIPLMLNLVVQELSSSKHEKEVCDVIEELEKLEGEEFGVNLEYCFFIYDKLPMECKEPFLDICSFFQGWDWDLVADLVGKAALERLERRALVAKGTNGVVTVHDVILEVGRRMAKKMSVRFSVRSELGNFLPEDEKVEQLRYLIYKPAKDMDQLIKNNLKMPPNLKYMEIDGNLHCNALEFFPASLLRLPDLRILKLINFQGLKELPSVLGHLVKGLRELTLSNCNSFKELPYSISKLKSLRVLRINHCPSVQKLPHDIGNLVSLVELDLSNCESLNLNVLPDNFRKLVSLRVLNLSFCKALECLPDAIGKLTSLDHLDLSHCTKLKEIPESIGLLKRLRSVDISFCSNLKGLPNEFCDLSAITNLKLTRCGSIEKLPNEFGNLQSLRVLKLKSCTALEELPESFSKLESLVQLDLSKCSTLKELCKDFHGLSSLRTLSLHSCTELKKLPENFHCLSLLQSLDLSGCEKLEGKWIDNVVESKPSARVNITNSDKLVERWREIQSDQSPDLHVYTGQDFPEEKKENEWKHLSSEFESLLQNRRGEPLHLSTLPPNTILLVVFDGSPDFNQEFPWPLIEETIDDVQINFEIVYIGKHFNKLPKTVANKISGRALDNSDARLLLEKVFFTLQGNPKSTWHKKMNKFFSMRTKIMRKRDREESVSGKENGDNYLSCWTLLSDCEMEAFVLENCGRFLWLKQLAPKNQENSIRFLTELFVNMGEDYCLLRKSDKVGLDQLRRKTILLEIRPANAIYDSRLQSLENLYITEKERSNLEIISIPIGQQSIKFEQFSGNIPWLVLQNAWTITTAAEKYFLIKALLWEDPDGKWYPSRFLKIEPNKEVAHVPVLSMLERWGPNVYPFSDEKVKELREEESNQRKSMSSLKFILKPLMGELDQMKEVMLKRKMICLVCDGNHPRTKRVRTKTFEECIMSAMKEVKDSIQFIYVHPTETERLTVTDTVKVPYFPLESDSKEKELQLKLPYSLIVPPWAAMRLRMRVRDLREEIKAVDENDEQLQGMKILLDSLDTGHSSMAIIDEDGKVFPVFTSRGIQIVDIFENRKEKAVKGDAKESVGDRVERQEARKRVRGMIKLIIEGSKEERKEALLNLESYLS